MASNLTDQNISDTYKQLLHIDGGSVSSQGKKRVRDGNGRPTAIAVSNNASAPANKGLEVDGTVSADNIDLKSFNGVERQIGDNLIKALVDLFYPIGSLYLQGDIIDTKTVDGVNQNDALFQDPGLRFPGTTWKRVSRGRYLVGVGGSGVDNVEPVPGGYTKTTKIDPYTRHTVFEPPTTSILKYQGGLADLNGNNFRVFAGPDMFWVDQSEGGHKWDAGGIIEDGYPNFRAGQYKVQLKETEMPRHRHICQITDNSSKDSIIGDRAPLAGTETIQTSDSNGDVAPYTDEVGGDQPHENIPPWYGCLVWKRVK